jgi:hypothetical protein
MTVDFGFSRRKLCCYDLLLLLLNLVGVINFPWWYSLDVHVIKFPWWYCLHQWFSGSSTVLGFTDVLWYHQRAWVSPIILITGVTQLFVVVIDFCWVVLTSIGVMGFINGVGFHQRCWMLLMFVVVIDACCCYWFLLVLLAHLRSWVSPTGFGFINGLGFHW